ncbi:OLC1v1000258C1 [Oldenlandia corymbosa var. corymbosa]|nr:OLC1v1000258C1 [Oldenlandia corymbosa var. corymbosa]
MVIITVVNKAYVEPHHDQYPTMFDIFLEGFWVGERTQFLLDHLLVVSMDQTAYNRCLFRRLNCYRLITEGVDFTEEKLYMTADFIKMMWARTAFLLDVLKRGYSFIFTDTDIIWLRDPFPRLKMYKEIDDMQMSTDRFNGYPSSTQNSINTGFYHVRSNNKTITLFETWYGRRTSSAGMKEQDVLAKLITKEGVIDKLGLRARFLDNDHFSGFCSDSKEVNVVVTVHANCCRSIGAKVADLTRVLKDWKTLRDPNNTSNATTWSKHEACGKAWTLPPSLLT